MSLSNVLERLTVGEWGAAAAGVAVVVMFAWEWGSNSSQRAAQHAAEMLHTNRQYVSDAKRLKALG